ncbi:hypothetical protein VTK56DRAFT_3782 [Thermocarpiscus australiensis]
MSMTLSKRTKDSPSRGEEAVDEEDNHRSSLYVNVEPVDVLRYPGSSVLQELKEDIHDPSSTQETHPLIKSPNAVSPTNPYIGGSGADTWNMRLGNQ